MLTRRTVLAGAAVLAAPAISRAQAAPIRIGEINSYSAIPSFTLPYRNGWQMAVEQINEAGGVLGRKLEVLSRDDAGKPQDAIRLAGELLDEQKVDVLSGGFLSNVGLALSRPSASGCSWPESLCRMRWCGRRGTGSASASARPPTCRRRCWPRKRRSCRPSVG